MSHTQRRWIFRALGATAGSAAVAVIALLIGGTATADKMPAPIEFPAPLVSVVEVQPQSVVTARTFSARAESAQRVEVRARVQGILQSRLYQEGALVNAGDQLFQIDPERFAVQVQRAEGELNRAKAQLNQAQRDWNRVAKLFHSKTISERDRDQARSALELAQADVTVAEAALNDARIQLAYTQVKAPISGVTSQEILSEGNLVQEQTLLTTIIQLDPLHVQFAISEADAVALRRRAIASDHGLAIRLQLPDGSTYERAGLVDFTGAAVDPRTGTVQARAVFPNPEGLLMPGQFVRVSLDAAAQPELVVPHSAVAQGENGPVVYVINGADTVEARPVELGSAVEQGVVVRSGLAAGEQIVSDGIARLEPHGKVRIAAPSDTYSGSATTTASAAQARAASA